MAHCPYCESTRSLLVGQVYCSRHAGADMRALQSGTLYIRTERLEETADHVSRLSIRLMLNGRQWYKVGGADRLVHAENYLVINQGQEYRTAFEGDRELEMLMVGFRPGMAAQVARTLSTPLPEALEDPIYDLKDPGFFEQTYRMDPVIKALFGRLLGLMHGPADEHIAEAADQVHDRLMEHLVRVQLGMRAEADGLSVQRPAVRLELWRRLNRARDLAEAYPERALSVQELAQAACLSEHHFKRLFREAFGAPPGTYMRRIRLQRAQELLRGGAGSLAEAAQAAGYADAPAFCRAYRQLFRHTPTVDRTI